MTSPRIRVAAFFLILVAVVYAGSLWRTRTTARDFAARSTHHLNSDVARIRDDVRTIQHELDASAQRIAARISPNTPTPRLFAIVANEAAKPGRGARVLDADGEPLAWWGEDLRATGERTYEFD